MTTTTSPTFLVFTQNMKVNGLQLHYSYNSARSPSSTLVVQSSFHGLLIFSNIYFTLD